jgi:hypothetical protein
VKIFPRRQQFKDSSGEHRSEKRKTALHTRENFSSRATTQRLLWGNAPKRERLLSVSVKTLHRRQKLKDASGENRSEKRKIALRACENSS